MKHIIKQSEPIEFTEWKQQANEDWQPTYDILGTMSKNRSKHRLWKNKGIFAATANSV
jgi:hypothetical protein